MRVKLYYTIIVLIRFHFIQKKKKWKWSMQIFIPAWGAQAPEMPSINSI